MIKDGEVPIWEAITKRPPIPYTTRHSGEAAHESLGNVQVSPRPLIGNPHSINTCEATFTVPHNCMIGRPDIQYHHLVTRSSSSFIIDPIFPTMRVLHLMKAVPLAGKKKIVRCGSSNRIFSPKLKLVGYGSLIHDRIPSAKLKLVEF